jgi:hypothetical protein
MRILFSEGSSLSARESLTILGLEGHEIFIADPNPACICRFSRFASHYRRSPSPGREPEAYYRFVLRLIERERIELLLPVHEQAFLFSRRLDELSGRVAIALPPFESYRELFSKARFSRLLGELGLPQPEGAICATAEEARAWERFPAYLKTEYGTASMGVWRVESGEELGAALASPRVGEALEAGSSLIVQESAPGSLEIAQAAFDRGRLVAFHCARRLKEGANGSSSVKLGVERPAVRGHLEWIGRRLGWHGPLSVDYLYDDATGTPRYIDASPRLVEPMNAFVNGVDLPRAQLLSSLGRGAEIPGLAGTRGAKSRMALLALLKTAGDGGSRRDILKELGDIRAGRGAYAGAVEELLDPGADPAARLPLALVLGRLLASPRAAARIASAAVGDYALSETAIREFGDPVSPTGSL